jgi:hypothetical protein
MTSEICAEREIESSLPRGENTMEKPAAAAAAATSLKNNKTQRKRVFFIYFSSSRLFLSSALLLREANDKQQQSESKRTGKIVKIFLCFGQNERRDLFNLIFGQSSSCA